MSDCVLMKASTGGVGSDDVTLTKSLLLEGYKTVTTDSNDEVIFGTMLDIGSQNAILNCGQNKVIPAGYTPGGTVTANSLANQTGGATATDDLVRSGCTYWKDGIKRTGNMPVQGADVSGTDRAYATNISAWEGTVCSGVRNGHRLEGVNWIQTQLPNFYASNIKRGVNIGGLVGTYEGYVASEDDLYNNGSWGLIGQGNLSTSWQSATGLSTGSIRYDSSQIALVSGSKISYCGLLINKPLDVTRYNNFNVSVNGGNVASSFIFIMNCGTGYSVMTGGMYDTTNTLGYISQINVDKNGKTLSINLTKVNTSVYFVIYLYSATGNISDYAYIKRMWLS